MDVLRAFHRVRTNLFVCQLTLLVVGLPSLGFGQPTDSSQDMCEGPLFRAIYREDTTEIEKLISAGTRLNVRACSGDTTPLIEAIVKGLKEIPKIMILAGADVNLESNDSTPLVLSSWYCRADLVPLLLQRGARVDSVDRDGNTALIAAARSCADEAIAMALVKAGASVNIRSKKGWTALEAAALNRKPSIVRELLTLGAQLPADPGMADFVKKVANGEEAELPEFGESVRDGCGSPLLAAIYTRDFVELDKIISAGGGLDFKGCESSTTPLIEAIGEGLSDVGERLIIAGANVNLAAGDGTTPLMMASWYQCKELVTLLLQRGADVNTLAKNGDSALIPAAQQSQDGDIVDLLIRAGADVDIRTKYGSTPLSVATFYGNERAVKLLVAAGADLNAKTDEGTPLEIARDRVVGRTEAHDRIYSYLLEVARKRSR